MVATKLHRTTYRHVLAAPEADCTGFRVFVVFTGFYFRSESSTMHPEGFKFLLSHQHGALVTALLHTGHMKNGSKRFEHDMSRILLCALLSRSTCLHEAFLRSCVQLRHCKLAPLQT